MSLTKFSRIYTLWMVVKYSVYFGFLVSSLRIQKVGVSSGPFRFSDLFLHQYLMLASLSGVLPSFLVQSHGKRGRRLLLNKVELSHDYMWSFIIKLISQVLPNLKDSITPKFRRLDNFSTYSFNLRINDRFECFTDFADILEGIAQSRLGIFMPMSVQFTISGNISSLICEALIRSIKIPISFYRRRPKPSFDDKIDFGQTWLYY